MDFFERQDKARRNTKWLVVYFVMAVVCIIASVYLACLVIFAGVSANQSRHRRVQLEAERGSSIQLWNPDIFSYAVLGTLAVVFCGSAWRLSSLSAGGSAVATSMGGRLVNPNTDDPDEQKLRNVVEEMALASGVPVPQIYVMDEEDGINAFAAGHTPSDAAIGVTRGCMKLLTRDELQGVIGHEFSHILNGDMRLNLRLMGIIFGILCLTIIGRILIRTHGKKNPLPLLGLALIIIGGLGVFFSKLIQAAVSRQREFLADASAVQFTRNPIGLAGALQKIGGLATGSRIENGHAAEASHMFFGNAVRSSFLGAFSTHPPLEQRIKAIDPGWDGKFRAVSAQDVGPVGRGRTRSDFSQRMAVAAGFAPPVIRAQTVMPSLGQPTTQHLRYAEELRASFSDDIRAAAHSPEGALALIYALLLSPDETLRRQQLAELHQRTSASLSETTARLAADASRLNTSARLPLVELALPALRQLRPDEFARFLGTLKWLIESDRQIDLFEYVLQKVITRHLAPHYSRVRPPVVQFRALPPLLPDCVVLLSALAYIGQTRPDEIQRAFGKGAPYLRSAEGGVALLAREHCGLGQVDRALNRLVLAAPQLKKHVIEACVQVVGADGAIQEHEAELLRAMADTLDCPIPPFVPAE